MEEHTKGKRCLIGTLCENACAKARETWLSNLTMESTLLELSKRLSFPGSARLLLAFRKSSLTLRRRQICMSPQVAKQVWTWRLPAICTSLPVPRCLLSSLSPLSSRNFPYPASSVSFQRTMPGKTGHHSISTRAPSANMWLGRGAFLSLNPIAIQWSSSLLWADPSKFGCATVSALMTRE